MRVPVFPEQKGHSNGQRKQRRVFTLVETLLAVSLMGLVTTAVIGALLFIMRSEMRLTFQSQMNSEVQYVSTLLRKSMRLSSIDEMQFWPSQGTPLAVSFPVPADSDDPADSELGTDGRVRWGETWMVYLWPHDDPEELRLTRFRERDNSLGSQQREEALEAVVMDGHGNNVNGDQDSVTKVLSQLSPQFSLHGQGKLYDSYTSGNELDSRALGGVQIQEGDNTILFKIPEKRTESGGYGLRIDQLRLSPAGIPIEAEALLPALNQTGASASIEENPDAGWSNGRWLDFPANSENAELELEFYNDSWHETRFRGGGDFTDCETYMNKEPGDVGMRLRPVGGEGQKAWTAVLQTRSSGEGATDNFLPGTAVRVVVRGEKADANNPILVESDGCRVVFEASDELDEDAGLYITDAFIAEAADHTMPGEDIKSGTTTRLQFGSPSLPQNNIWIPSGETAATVPVEFSIDPEKSYIVSYLVKSDEVGKQTGVPYVYKNPDKSAATDSYIMPADENPGVSHLQSSWHGNSGVEGWGGVLGIKEIQSTYADESTYTSRVVDTRQQEPEFEDLDWEATVPENTSVKIKVRTFNEPDQSDAPPWESIPALSAPGSVPFASSGGRYVQVRAILNSDPVNERAPELHNFTLRWPGESSYVDIGGVFGKYPNGGMVEVSVNGQEPAVSVRTDMSVRGTPNRGSPLSWALGIEITPRN